MVAAMRAIWTIRIVLIEAASIDASASYATFAAAVWAIAIAVEVVVVVVVRVGHPHFPLGGVGRGIKWVALPCRETLL